MDALFFPFVLRLLIFNCSGMLIVLPETENSACFLGEPHRLIVVINYFFAILFVGAVWHLLIFFFNHSVSGTTDLNSVHRSVLDFVCCLNPSLEFLYISLQDLLLHLNLFSYLSNNYLISRSLLETYTIGITHF